MATINVEPRELINNGKEIVSESVSYKDEINKIYSIIDELAGAWSGQAASKFTSDIREFKDDFENFGKLIGEFGELLVAVGTDYQRLEENL